MPSLEAGCKIGGLLERDKGLKLAITKEGRRQMKGDVKASACRVRAKRGQKNKTKTNNKPKPQNKKARKKKKKKKTTLKNQPPQKNQKTTTKKKKKSRNRCDPDRVNPRNPVTSLAREVRNYFRGSVPGA